MESESLKITGRFKVKKLKEAISIGEGAVHEHPWKPPGQGLSPRPRR